MADDYINWQELRGMLLAIGLSKVTRQEEWVSALLTSLNSAGTLLEADTYKRAYAALTAPTSTLTIDAARKMATDQARKAAGTLVTNMAKTELTKVSEVIAQGLKDGIGPREIARQLDMVKGLDSQRASAFLKYRAQLEASGLTAEEIAAREERYFQKLLKDRRETIAHNEAEEAMSSAREQEARARGAQWKVWITSSQGNVCDDCADNEAAGPIPINDSFPSGHDRDPAHPGDHCRVSYLSTEGQRDRAAERAGTRAEATARAREEARAAKEAEQAARAEKRKEARQAAAKAKEGTDDTAA